MTIKKRAKLSSCKRYRYALWRTWDEGRPKVLFICLNPSTADARKDDNTVRRCMSFAKKWKYGGLIMGNLFALRSTKPAELWKSSNPIGPINDDWLRKLKSESRKVIAAWGNKGNYRNRAQIVRKMFPNLYSLGITKQGQSRHPLYLSKNSKVIKW